MEITSLPAFRFLKRMAKTKQEAESLTKLASDADIKLKDVNEQLKRNIEAQRILNKHLAGRNKERKTTATVIQFPNK
jgi:hypothetical protein